MNCPYCNNPNQDGARFCLSCGYPLPSDAPAESAAPAKKKRHIWIPIVIVCAVLAAAAACLLTVGRGFLLRTVGKPEAYFAYVGEQNINALIDRLDGGIGNAKKVVGKLGSMHNDGKVTLELSDSAKTYINTFAGQDLSWFKSAAINYDFDWKDDAFDGSVAASLNGIKLVSAEGVVDVAQNAMAMRIPEISDQYVDFSEKLGRYGKASDSTEGQPADNSKKQQLQALENLFSDQKTTENLKTLLKRYVKVALKDMKNVQKINGQSIYAGSVSMKCMELTVMLTDYDIQNIVRDVCMTAQTDSELKELVTDIGIALDKESLYSDFITELAKTAADPSDISIDGTYQLSVYVDGLSRIRGLKITRNSNRGVTETVHLLVPVDGKRFGVDLGDEYSYNNDYRSSYLMSGEGTVEGTRLSGTFTGYSNNKAYYSIELRDIDLSAAKNGETSGGITLKLTSTGAERLSRGDEKVSALLPLLTLTLDFNTGAGRTDTMIALNMQEEKLLSLHIENNSSDTASPEAVPAGVTMDEWKKAVMNDGSLSAFLTDLTSKLPEELSGGRLMNIFSRIARSF